MALVYDPAPRFLPGGKVHTVGYVPDHVNASVVGGIHFDHVRSSSTDSLGEDTSNGRLSRTTRPGEQDAMRDAASGNHFLQHRDCLSLSHQSTQLPGSIFQMELTHRNPLRGSRPLESSIQPSWLDPSCAWFRARNHPKR